MPPRRKEIRSEIRLIDMSFRKSNYPQNYFLSVELPLPPELFGFAT